MKNSDAIGSRCITARSKERKHKALSSREINLRLTPALRIFHPNTPISHNPSQSKEKDILDDFDIVPHRHIAHGLRRDEDELLANGAACSFNLWRVISADARMQIYEE